VVLVIVGVLVGTAVLSIGGRTDEALREEIERMAALLRLSQEEAILQSRELGLGIWRDGYGFYRLAGEQWQRLTDDELLHSRELPEAAEVALFLEGVKVSLEPEPRNKPQVFILSSGEMSAFELTLSTDGAPPHRLQADAMGRIEMELADGG